MINESKVRFYTLLKQEVEVRFSRGASSLWKNRDFQDLSFEIFQATKITVSPGTLKRIFGKARTSENYYPQPATLEALVKYAQMDPKAPNKEDPQEEKTSSGFRKKMVTGLALITLLVIITLLSLNPGNNQTGAITIIAFYH